MIVFPPIFSMFSRLRPINNSPPNTPTLSAPTPTPHTQKAWAHVLSYSHNNPVFSQLPVPGDHISATPADSLKRSAKRSIKGTQKADGTCPSRVTPAVLLHPGRGGSFL